MKKLFYIPTNQQLVNIATAISDELSDIKKDNICIVFELDKDLLRQIDEEYYFKNNKDSNEDSFTPSDEVEVIVSEIKFKFIEKQDDSQEENTKKKKQ
jgi:hypothetical protein